MAGGEMEGVEINDKDVINALILCRSMMKCMGQFCKQLTPFFGESEGIPDCDDCMRVYHMRKPQEGPSCEKCLGVSASAPKIYSGSKGDGDGTLSYFLMVGEHRFDFDSQGERDLFHARLLMSR